MNTKNNKDELSDLVKRSMLEIKDDSFTELIVDKHIARKEERKLRLFWNTDLLTLLIASCLFMSFIVLLIKNNYLITINEISVEYEHLMLILSVSFALIVFKYGSEFIQVKNTLPNTKK